VERVISQVVPTEENLRYLQTKRDRMGHLLDLPTSPAQGVQP
jgi:GTP cyclohydrolase II